jgi:D-alanine-D-alanine ligase
LEVGVIFGGPSPEHDVSILTGLQASRCLAEGGHRVRALYWTKTGEWFEVDPRLEGGDFVDGLPKGSVPLRLVVEPGGGFQPAGRSLRARQLPIEVAVVCCHGGPGEDGTLQAALDLAGLRHTGPSVAGAALGMDKLAFGALIGSAGLPTLPRRALLSDGPDPGFSPPFIVKPRFGGSSIGIEVVADMAVAASLLETNVHLASGAVIEPYRPELFDLQVAVRSYPELQTSAIERPLRQPGPGGSPEILRYQDKYAGGEGMVAAPRELPARIDEVLQDEIRRAAFEVARLCGVTGTARVDFLSDGSNVWVNEINTIPGSLAWYLWVEPPVSFRVQLELALEEARALTPRKFVSTGADGLILRDVSSIAAKLA